MIFQVLEFIKLPRRVYSYLPLHQYNGMSRVRTAVKDVLSLKPTLGDPGDLVSVIARARNSRVRENNKLFCFQSYEITCNYANIKFLIWPYTSWKKIRSQAGNSHDRIHLKNRFFIFLYRYVALYHVSQDFG